MRHDVRAGVQPREHDDTGGADGLRQIVDHGGGRGKKLRRPLEALTCFIKYDLIPPAVAEQRLLHRSEAETSRIGHACELGTDRLEVIFEMTSNPYFARIVIHHRGKAGNVVDWPLKGLAPNALLDREPGTGLSFALAPLGDQCCNELGV